jgi:hypothetical protein
LVEPRFWLFTRLCSISILSWRFGCAYVRRAFSAAKSIEALPGMAFGIGSLVVLNVVLLAELAKVVGVLIGLGAIEACVVDVLVQLMHTYAYLSQLVD